MVSTKLKTYTVVYDPTGSRTVDNELACIRLKIEDSTKNITYWSEPLTGKELTRILGADRERPTVDPDSQGISPVTALLTSAAFNFKDEPRKAGEAQVVRRPSEELLASGTLGSKWLGDVRVRKYPAGKTGKQIIAQQTQAAAKASRPKEKTIYQQYTEMAPRLDLGDLLKDFKI